MLTVAAGLAVVDSCFWSAPLMRVRFCFRYRARPAPIARPTSHPTNSMAKMEEETSAVPTTVSLPEQ